MIRPTSLRRRLWLAGLSGIVLVTLVATWLLGEAFSRASERSFDRALGNEHAALVGRLETRPDGSIGLRNPQDVGRYARAFSGAYWQVGTGPNALISRSLWDFDVELPSPRDDGVRETLQAIGPAGQSLRVVRQRITLPRATLPVHVWVAEEDSALKREVAEFRVQAAVAVGLLSALFAAGLAVQVNVGLRPLGRLGQQLAQVREGSLARLPTAGLPAEIQPLAGHLNQLLDHHEHSVKRARRLAADLAHALKTPLAALDAAAQKPGPTLAATVLRQCDRMLAVVRRRLDAAGNIDFRARTAVAPVVAALASMLTSVHRTRGVAFELNIAEDAVFPGVEEDLEELLGNLMDNACKWAAEKTRVSASLCAGQLMLTVEDDGPGIDQRAAELVVRRGRRLDERVPGSGLGLAIVQDLLDNYGGRLVLASSSLGGLRATAMLAVPMQHTLDSFPKS